MDALLRRILETLSPKDVLLVTARKKLSTILFS